MQQSISASGNASDEVPEPEQAGDASRRIIAGGILCLTALLVIGKALFRPQATPHGAAGVAPVASDMAPPDDNVRLDIKNAAVAYDQHDRPAVRTRLTARSAIAYFRFTRFYQGRIIELLVDGRVVSAPRIVEPITGGLILLSGSLTYEEAARIAQRLKTHDARLTVRVRDTD
jgi:SecD-like export protein